MKLLNICTVINWNREVIRFSVYYVLNALFILIYLILPITLGSYANYTDGENEIRGITCPKAHS